MQSLNLLYLKIYYLFVVINKVLRFAQVCYLFQFIIALIAWSNPCQCFGPYSLIEDAEEKMTSAHNSQEIIRVPSREQTPLQDGNVHTYGSLWEDKKAPIV